MNSVKGFNPTADYLIFSLPLLPLYTNKTAGGATSVSLIYVEIL